MANSNFVKSPVFTGIFQRYMPGDFISRNVMPALPVPARIFNWDYRDIRQMMSAPPNEVGRLDRPPTLEFFTQKKQAEVKMYGYDVPVPEYDNQEAADQRRAGYTGVDPEDDAATGASHMMRLREEKRVADIYNDPANFGTTTAIANGANQWNDSSSRPKETIQSAMRNMLVKPNVGVCGQVSYDWLVNHPQLVESVRGTGAREGRITGSELASILGLERIEIGMTWADAVFDRQIDIERSGNFNANRLWGNMFALVRIDPNVRSTQSMFTTWGFAATYGTDFGGSVIDGDMGIHGGKRIRAANERIELVSAKYAGHLFTNVVPADAAITVDQANTANVRDYTGGR